MAYKVYSLRKALYLTTSFQCNGKQVWVDFEGGTMHGIFTPGTFGTRDAVLQESIEKDNGYGTDFILNKELTALAAGKEDKPAKNEAAKDPNEGCITVDGVSSAQEAKAWLLATYTDKITPDDVANIAKMKEIMETVDEKPIRFTNYNPR